MVGAESRAASRPGAAKRKTEDIFTMEFLVVIHGCWGEIHGQGLDGVVQTGCNRNGFAVLAQYQIAKNACIGRPISREPAGAGSGKRKGLMVQSFPPPLPGERSP